MLMLGVPHCHIQMCSFTRQIFLTYRGPPASSLQIGLPGHISYGPAHILAQIKALIHITSDKTTG